MENQEPSFTQTRRCNRGSQREATTKAQQVHWKQLMHLKVREASCKKLMMMLVAVVDLVSQIPFEKGIYPPVTTEQSV